jgi:hypothetical protein
MYPGGVDFEWRNGEIITSLDPEWKKPKLPKINFNDPESPDYISASPAFDVYYENERAKKIDRELEQQSNPFQKTIDELNKFSFDCHLEKMKLESEKNNNLMMMWVFITIGAIAVLLILSLFPSIH